MTETHLAQGLNNAECDVVALTGSGTIRLTQTIQVDRSDLQELRENSGDSVAIIADPSFSGAGIEFRATSGSVKISNLEFSGFRDSAIQSASDLTIDGGVFANNSSLVDGGAIKADKQVTLLGAIVFQSNTAASGGAIVANSVSAEASSVTFNSNSTSVSSGKGGAVFVSTDATFGTIEITSSFSDAGGGGIWVVGNLTADVARFSSTSSDGNGGSVYSGGNQHYRTLVINSGYSPGKGGGLYAGGNVTATESFGSSATSADQGGGVIFSLGTVSLANPNIGSAFSPLDGGAIHGSQVNLTGNAVFSQSSTMGSGGAVYATGDFTAEGLQITNGNASAEGGGVYAGGNVTVTGTSNFDSTSTTTGSGGSIFAVGDASFAALTVIDGAAGFDGGAIYARDVTVTGNLSINSTSSTLGAGGALYATRDVSLAGGTIGTTATQSDGGAIYAGGNITSSASLNVTQSNAVLGDGGALFAGGNVSLAGGRFESNASGTSGGAIYAGGNVSSTSSLTLLTNNSTMGSGGGIFVAGSATLNGGDFDRNSADANGGAIYSSTGSITITGSLDLYQNNAVNGSGGAIATDGDPDLEAGNISLGAVFAESNQSTTGGGAISAPGTVSVSGTSIFFMNSSTADSGGAIEAGLDVVFSGAVTLDANSALLDGGAVYAGRNFNATARLETVENNSNTGSGGAIFAIGSASLASAEFYDDSASVNGGALHAAGLTTTGALSFISNYAINGSGGGGYVTGDATVFSLNLNGNSAEVNAGGLWVDGVANIGAVEALSNQANTGIGGALAVNSPATIASIEADGNTAGSDGGAVYVNGNLTVPGSANMDQNRSLNGSGGALLSGDLEIRGDAEFIQNDSGGPGGGIDAADVKILGRSTFIGNESLGDVGGAIYALDVEISSGLFTLNIGFEEGGAIAADTVVVSNASFHANEAGLGGGAISAIRVTSYNNYFTENSLDGPGFGGAISAEISELAFTSFVNNVALVGSQVGTTEVFSIGSLFSSAGSNQVAADVIYDMGGNVLTGSASGWTSLQGIGQDALDIGSVDYVPNLDIYVAEIGIDSLATNQVTEEFLSDVISPPLSEAFTELLADLLEAPYAQTDIMGNPRTQAPFDAGAFEFQNEPLLEISQAELQSDGLTLTLTLSVPVLASQGPEGFSLEIAGEVVEFEVSDVALGDTSITLTLSEAQFNDAVLTLSYTPGDIGSQAEERNLLGEILDLQVTNSSALTRVSGPVPYFGPVIFIPTDLGSLLPGTILNLEGQRLDTVTSITMGERDAQALTISSTQLQITIPELAPGFFALEVESSFGRLQVQPTLEVADSRAEVQGIQIIVKRMSDSHAKVWAKNPVGQGKVQFFLNGQEIAWVRATDNGDPKLRFANNSYYLVRTLNLPAGKNAIEIYVDGERLRRVAYTG